MPGKRQKLGSGTIAMFIILPILLIAFIVVLAQSGIIGAEQQINLTPSVFQPARITTVKFLVKDAATGATVPGGEIIKSDDPTVVGHFVDPTYKYPKVDLFNSQLFITDMNGNALTPEQQNNIPSEKLVVDGNVYFLTKYYMGIDVGVRTYSNMPPVNTETLYLSPWNGYTYTRISQIWPCESLGSNTWTIADDPSVKGALLMSVDMGQYNWAASGSPTTRYIGGATITTSLEPMDFKLWSYNPDPLPGRSYNEVMRKVRENYGNSKVLVTPVIDLQGMSNYIRYSYNQTVQLSNGTSVSLNIDTTSAQVGFSDAYDAYIDQSGLIPNRFDSRFKIAMTPDEEQKDKTRGTPASVVKTGTEISVTTTGYITYMGDITDPENGNTITGAATPYPGIVSNIQSVPSLHIDLNNPTNFSLPQDLQIRSDFELQPTTNIKIAQCEVQWGGYFFDAVIPCLEGETRTDKNTIKFPYAINIQNVYAMKRAVFQVTILSENEVQGIMANGMPFDVSKLTDFELNSIINNPNSDNMIWTQTTTTTDVIALLTTASITTIIIVVVIVVVTLRVISSRRRGGGAARGGGSSYGGWDFARDVLRLRDPGKSKS